MIKLLIFCLAVTVTVYSKSDVTFKDVTISGYSVFTKKFEKKIVSSNSLGENLPESIFDKIEIVNQTVPVLYENSVRDIEDLDEIVIEHSKLGVIKSGAFKNLPLLRRLSLKNNELREINSDVFNTLRLSTIDLSANQISVIASNAFDDMPDLLNINLADNRINIWDSKWFLNTPLLTRISMQNNLIKSLPANAFKNLHGSKKYGNLKLSMNLVLSYNQINEISPNAFDDLAEINNLWLDNNQITNFSDSYLINTDVKDLRLNSNNITCLDGDLSKIFKAENTYIDGNSFDCECLQKIIEWVEKNNKQVDMFYAKMTCAAERIKTKLVALENRLKNKESD